MSSNSEIIKTKLSELIDTGRRMYYDLRYDQLNTENKKKVDAVRLNFNKNYEPWYSEARAVIKQALPDRIEDFDLLYKNTKRKQIDFLTYTISDALIGLTTSRMGDTLCNPQSAIPKLEVQISILEAALKSIDSILFNLRNILQADLFDGELEEASILNKNGYVRAAGAVAGVVLEKHLLEVIKKKNVTVQKKNPSIGDLNEALKNANIIETKDWRYIQHLGDIRNLCDHKRVAEPKKEDIDDLILGVDKIIKTVG